jgi:diacylglycerol O-acyltransferase/trehalose O-mycolyltransferase
MPTDRDLVARPVDSGAAQVVDVEPVHERVVDLSIASPAVGDQHVRLILPATWEQHPAARWPVLYLLHGRWDDYGSWTRETDVVELTADHDLLVVMPDGGQQGFYSDWWNGGTGGPPRWETFHLVELPQLLERDWRAGERRAVAGLSMGGFGAISYAARQPGVFRAAASFSGVLDILRPGVEAPAELWGDREAQAEIWTAHDPVSLAAALRGTPLFVAYGDGEPGPLDAPGAAVDELEAWLAGMNETFIERLAELGIAATVDAYGAGTHTWPYWERSLHRVMPLLLDALAGRIRRQGNRRRG